MLIKIVFHVLSFIFSCCPYVFNTSNFCSKVEGSSLKGVLLSALALDHLDIKLASMLTGILYISSKFRGALSLSWYAISESNTSGNLIKAKSGGGLRFRGIAL